MRSEALVPFCLYNVLLTASISCISQETTAQGVSAASSAVQLFQGQHRQVQAPPSAAHAKQVQQGDHEQQPPIRATNAKVRPA